MRTRMVREGEAELKRTPRMGEGDGDTSALCPLLLLFQTKRDKWGQWGGMKGENGELCLSH